MESFSHPQGINQAVELNQTIREIHRHLLEQGLSPLKIALTYDSLYYAKILHSARLTQVMTFKNCHHFPPTLQSLLPPVITLIP